MCTDHRPEDPRDAVELAGRALDGLRRLLAASDVEAGAIAPLVELIHDRLDPVVVRLADYVPRGWTPPAD